MLGIFDTIWDLYVRTLEAGAAALRQRPRLARVVFALAFSSLIASLIGFSTQVSEGLETSSWIPPALLTAIGMSGSIVMMAASAVSGAPLAQFNERRYEEALARERARIRRSLNIDDESDESPIVARGPIVDYFRDAERNRSSGMQRPQGPGHGNIGFDQHHSTSVVAVIRLSLNQLESYYVQTKRQARTSFNASVISSGLAFVTIAAGVWLFYLQPNPNLPLTAVSMAAGILTQLLGLTYFLIYRRTNASMREYHTQLLRSQDTLLAVELCREIPDEAARVQSMRKVVDELMLRGREPATSLFVKTGREAVSVAKNADAE